jgi:hypothetical protein
VLLTREDDFETWLSGAPKEAMVLAQEYPPSAVRIVQEGSDHEDRLPVAEIDARQKCQQDLAGSR